jgi:acyl-coenzyme A synthetase/AMP-(fatty) acid ligase
MIIEEISNYAKNFNNKIALKDNTRTVNYLELYERILNISYFLRKKYLLKEQQSVIIYCEKNIHSIEWILSIININACFIPIDIKNPFNRLKKIIESENPVLILCDTEDNFQKLKLNSPYTVININHNIDIDYNLKIGKDSFVIRNDYDRVYSMYTSGTTSHPKKVSINLKNLKSFFEDIEEFYHVNNNSRCMNTSSLAFDVFILDVIYPLYKGAFIYITPDFLSPPLINSVLILEKITHFCAVSSKLTLISKAMNNDFNYFIEEIMTGAEVLNINALNKIFSLKSNIKIINGYGPTEATCTCLCQILTKNNFVNCMASIGKPLKNIKAILIDNHQNICDEGELLLSGSQVIQVTNIDEQERYFLTIDNINYYKTGDICKRDKNNNYYFVSRINEQVKLNGHRVNILEIQNYLSKLSYIEDSFVFIFNEEIYCCLKINLNNINSKRIKNDLKSFLPEYLIPKKYFFINEFPYLTSDKKDVLEIKKMVGLYHE